MNPRRSWTVDLMKVWIACALSSLILASAAGCQRDGLRPEDIGLSGPHGDARIVEIGGDHDPLTLRTDPGLTGPEGEDGSDIIRVGREDLFRLREGQLRHISVAELNVGDSIWAWATGELSTNLVRAVAVIR